jgi:GT2 family glycosyltransferase
MLAEVGLLDESYIAYLDDADLAWRMRLAGWKALYEPGAGVLHAYNGTGGRNLERLLFLVNRNRLFTVLKDASGQMVWRVFRHLTFDAGANVRMWLIKLRVLGSLGRHLPRLLIERRQIHRRRRISEADVERWFTPASEWERIWAAQLPPRPNDRFLPSEAMTWLR